MRGDAVVAVGAEALNAGEFGEAARCAAAGEHGDEINRLRDQGARDGDDGFLNELLHAAERADGGAGVDGADAAGMAGAPGLQQIERLGTSDLADRNAVGAQAERGADEIGERSDAVLCPHGDEVRRGALQFARILDQDDAIRGLGDLGEQRVGKGRLTGGCAAGDEDVAAVCDSLA